MVACLEILTLFTFISFFTIILGLYIECLNIKWFVANFKFMGYVNLPSDQYNIEQCFEKQVNVLLSKDTSILLEKKAKRLKKIQDNYNTAEDPDNHLSNTKHFQKYLSSWL